MDIPQWIKDVPLAAVALVISALSLLISGGSLFVNWRNYRRDRSYVIVELKWNAEIIHIHGARSPIKECFAHIIVTNQGRRPVHINFIGLELPGRKRVINWLDNTVKLGEGDASVTIRIAQDSTLEPFVKQWEKIFASASDNTGRAYKSKRGNEPPVIVPGFSNWETAKRLQEVKWPLDMRSSKPEQSS